MATSMRNKFPARAIHTPPFRTRGMTGNRLFNRTPSTKEIGYGKPGNSTRTVGSTEFIIHRLSNNVNLMRAILCGGSLIFYAAQNQHFKNPAKNKKGTTRPKKSPKSKKARTNYIKAPSGRHITNFILAILLTIKYI